MADRSAVAKVPAPRPPRQYERRIEFLYEQRQVRALVLDAELAEWRLVACFPDAGLQYVLIFEREV